MRPKHIAIILDGNRRYAKKKHIAAMRGHEVGGKILEKLLDWASSLGIKELTLYIFSMENFNRSKAEFNYLMSLFKKQFLKLENDPRIEKEKIHVNFIGRLELFPVEIQNMAKRMMKKTRKNNGLIINFAMGYSGRTELVDAVKKILSQNIKPKNVNEEVLRKHLYLSSYPDMIIRTGGERRVSNFLIFQGAYSEWFFLDKMWPEFTKNDLKRCIDEFSNRERRFGR